MSFTADELYELLPAVYRIRDAELKQGEPLKALVAVLAEQAGVVEEDIAQLYENWFIETCDEWLVPYIGDLLGVRGLHDIGRLHSIDSGVAFSQRARVANTIRYRRRKGTAAVLEQLARDTTGWNARAVEFFELLATTQHYNHRRLHNHRTPDLRRANTLDLLNTAFDTIAHTAEVRRITSNRGRYNIPNIGLFLWRLQAYYIQSSQACAVVNPADERYRFNPLGDDTPLFNRPQTETEITHLAEEINVPGLLRRRPLYDELEAYRQALTDGETLTLDYFGKQPVFEVFVQSTNADPYVEVAPEKMLICNLTDWTLPPNKKTYTKKSDGTKPNQPIEVAVDPVLGRLTFPQGVTPHRVKVSYAYGFSGDVGGGPYNRYDSFKKSIHESANASPHLIAVSKEVTPVAGEIIHPNLTAAVAAWDALAAGVDAVIVILDNCTYEENLTLNIPKDRHLAMVAAEWPVVEDEDQNKSRPAGIRYLEPDEWRPHLLGSITVTGAAGAADPDPDPGSLAIDGLLIEGKLTVKAGRLVGLRLAHTTLVPDEGGLLVEPSNERLEIELERCICGPIRINTDAASLCITESIIDGNGGAAIDAAKTPVDIQKSTVFGATGVGPGVRTLEAGNSIFMGLVTVERRQQGCVRFSYVPPKSVTPRRYRCQPALALIERAKALGHKTIKDLEQATPAEAEAIRVRLIPTFTARTYGQHDQYAYAQLRSTCAPEIREGADDGSEMGVFSFLLQPQRIANLRASLDEYLRFGLKAGLIFAT